MKIIDAHAHLLNEPKYLEELLKTMDSCGIEKCCLIGLGQICHELDNKDIKKALDNYPDRIIGVAFVRPGVDTTDKIAWAYEQGFRMLKVVFPKHGYDHPSFFTLWNKVDEYRMPILFHTGVVTCKDLPGEQISSWNMHPMRIEPISRELPNLKIIVAHLGVHWNSSAAELARMRPNVYVDLTGSLQGWRKRADSVGMEKWLWWPDAFKKVIFGTDVHYSKIPTIITEDKERVDKLGLSQDTKEKIFFRNIENLLCTGLP